MPSVLCVPVAIDRAAPSIRAIMSSVALTEGVDWTWAWGAAENQWCVWLDAAARSTALPALQQHRSAVADALSQAKPQQGYSLAQRVALASLLGSAKVQFGGAIDLGQSLVAKALLDTAPNAMSYANAAGTWQVKEDRTGEVIAVRLSGTQPAWASSVPGVWYEGQAAVVPMERAPALARKLAERAPSLACSMLRALGLLPEPMLPEDTDWLTSAVDYGDLPPDLAVAVEKMTRRLVWPMGLRPRADQEIATAFATAVGGRALIGDAPGIGKSLVAISFLKLDLHKHTPSLIIAPASALTNWRDEIQRWAPSLTPVVVDASTQMAAKPGAVWIVSWARIHSLVTQIKTLGLRSIIADEAHLSKTSSTQRGIAFAAFAKAVPYVLALTGTPVENRVGELFHLLHALRPDIYTGRAAFMAKYGSAKNKVIGDRTFSDDRRDSLLPELRQALRGIMVRRLKTDVLNNLPEKTRTPIWVDLPPAVRRAYDDAEKNIDAIVAEGIRKKRLAAAVALVQQGCDLRTALQQANALPMGSPSQLAVLAIVVLGHMRRLVGRAKIPQLYAWLDEFLETGEPIIVFLEHHEVRDELGALLTKAKVKWTSIDGDVEIEERGKRVKAFQAGQIDVLLAGLRSANTGITLTRASHVLFAERALVPAIEEQGEDRAWRYGQKNAVNAWYFMAKGTVDERLEVINSTKRVAIARAIGEEAVSVGDGGESDLSNGAVRQAAGIFAGRVDAAVRAWRGGTDVVITDEGLRLALAGKG